MTAPPQMQDAAHAPKAQLCLESWLRLCPDPVS